MVRCLINNQTKITIYITLFDKHGFRDSNNDSTTITYGKKNVNYWKQIVAFKVSWQALTPSAEAATEIKCERKVVSKNPWIDVCSPLFVKPTMMPNKLQVFFHPAFEETINISQSCERSIFFANDFDHLWNICIFQHRSKATSALGSSSRGWWQPLRRNISFGTRTHHFPVV